ncbi:MAG: hypothetical protein V2I43_07300 [Parvularcula sp.]|nr:hypothetical protein [Parvularcula sp.]
MTEEHRRYVRTETIVSIILSIILSLVFAWLVFPKTGSIPFGGMGGMAFDLVPTTFMIVLMTTVALSLLTRARKKKGTVSALDLSEVPQGRSVVLAKRLPGHFILRALALAVGACAVFLPLMIGMLTVLNVSEMSFAPFLVFKAIYGAFLAAIFTPTILIAALAEERTAIPATSAMG